MFFKKYKSVHFEVCFLICSVFLLIFSTQVFARSWCSSAKLNITEQTICNNLELRELDAQLAQVYSTAKAHNEDSKQLDWLKNYRNACYGNINCIAQEYRNRIAILKGRIDFVYAENSRPWCSASRLNTTEKTICKTSYLRDLDAELQLVYGQARARKEDSGQIDWLRKERNACGSNESCISQAYRDRLSTLLNRMQKYQVTSINRNHSSYQEPALSYNANAPNTTTRRCSDTHLNELKAVCVISAVGEHACSSKLSEELPSSALSSATASGVCTAAAGHLIDGSIDPRALGLSVASGFLSGAGDPLLKSDDSFSAFFGVVFKIGSFAMTAVSINECFQNAERVCR
jgi:uncharacterized protein